MTLCHRPTCRKEGVLLDYSTDGGVLTTGVRALHGVFPFSAPSARRLCVDQVCPGRCCTRWTI